MRKPMIGHGLKAALTLFLSAGVTSAETGKILYLGVGSASAEYWQEVIWGAEQVMKSVGGKTEVFSNEFDGQRSFQNISAIVSAGCEGCLFTWFPDSSAFTRLFVDRIDQAGGLITTLWNRPEEIHPWDTSPQSWVANLSFDGQESAWRLGMELCKAIGGTGEIVVLKGTADNAPTKQREAGLARALDECPGMKVLDQQYADWQQSLAQDITRTWLVRDGDRIKGIFAQNDGMALGAVAALREKGLAGKIPVTGSDGSSDVLKLIQSGEILATNRGNSEAHGAVAAALVYGVSVGDLKIEDLTEAQRDFFVSQTMVTKDNVDAVIAAKPDPANFTYEAIGADFWSASVGQIRPGMH